MNAPSPASADYDAAVVFDEFGAWVDALTDLGAPGEEVARLAVMATAAEVAEARRRPAEKIRERRDEAADVRRRLDELVTEHPALKSVGPPRGGSSAAL